MIAIDSRPAGVTRLVARHWPAFALLVAGALVQGASYWPGIMTWDALNQYGQAVSGEFDDWHPPVMAWIWRRLLGIHSGPAPMFVLQLLLYWMGAGLLVAGAFHRRQAVAAWLFVVVVLLPFPLALLGSVLKDCLMQGALLIAAGLLVLTGRERGWAARLVIWALLLFAGTLRFNAFLATVPLALAAAPAAWRGGALRATLLTAGAAAASLVAMPLANRAIGADHSDVQLSLAMFDMAGVTVRSGEDMFPPMGVADPVAVARACYKPDKWDYFSSWANPLCPITFDKLDPIMDARGLSPYPLILHAALRHPIAYLEHRFAHFNINTRFLVHDEVQGPVPDRATENEYGFRVPPNPGLLAISAVTRASIHSPLGWPIVWIVAAAGLLALCPGLPSASLVAPLAASGLFYGLGYLPFSVSSELRYNLWTITATALAGAFVVADRAAIPRARVLASLAPAVIVAALCLIWRLT